MKTALQLYSVRDEVEKDFEGTLKAVSEFGYDGVEFAGLYGKTPEDVRKLCEKYGLVPVSAHVGIGEMLENDNDDIYYAYIIKNSSALDCVEQIEKYIDKLLHKQITRDEKIYLIVHITRITTH